VGKIACLSVAAWARRTRDFAHADRAMPAPLPTLRFSGSWTGHSHPSCPA
jgi:hypothetical protein